MVEQPLALFRQLPLTKKSLLQQRGVVGGQREVGENWRGNMQVGAGGRRTAVATYCLPVDPLRPGKG